MEFGLGFDTGGTNTDAVVMNLTTGEIICTNKAPTTRQDLTIGISEAISRFDPELLSKVSVVSLSSTLATNSVVEGKGCRVALICIGEDYDQSVNADAMVRIRGAHDLHGKETDPLDEDAARDFLESVKGKVDGIAVTGYLAVRNPDHENRVAEMASGILDVPVVCSHQLSSGLGFSERAATCIMNARLIPIIDDLIRSVKRVLESFGIDAPLMIVRGDGSMMSESMARRRPVDTILSGPAASMIGAMHLTGVRDAIVMDMGGTTTDIGILRNGKPKLEPEGALIGGKKTRVMAAEISTSGIGGDSRIFVRGRKVLLSPLRVIPLCVAVGTWPHLKDSLRRAPAVDNRPVAESLNDSSIVLESEFFRTLRLPDADPSLLKSDIALLELLADRPLSLREAADALGTHPFTFNVSKLEERGFLQRIGLTPTDILHVSGEFDSFDSEASRLGVEYLSVKTGLSVDVFIRDARDAIRDKLCIELMRKLFLEETRTDAMDVNAMDLVMKSIKGREGSDYSCRITLNKPIIGIGAPVGVYLGWVAERFGTTVLFNEHSSVGNAVGAITSMVTETLDVLLKPSEMGNEESKWEVFSKLGNSIHDTLDDALSFVIENGSIHVRDVVSASGVEDIDVEVERRDRRFTYGDDASEVLMQVELRISAAGKPKPFNQG